jgi:hypothetical protein
MLPPLPPLCRPHENLVTWCEWNLHGENRVQFPILGDLLFLRALPDLFYRCHQIVDQCARVHFRYLKLDSYHGTLKNAFSYQPLALSFFWRIFVRLDLIFKL